jgi:predicted HTH transcriptional regulator
MTDQEFAGLLALGHEQQGVEFKGPGPRSDKQFFAKVVRAALGMANRRDGGRVIIGVREDQKGKLKPRGLGATDLATWKYDDVASGLSSYADPSIRFDLEILTYKRKKYVILRVHEFEDIYLFCAKKITRGFSETGLYTCEVRASQRQ